jgi:serine/threonine-protein kinase
MGLAKRLLPAGGSIRESLVADQISMKNGAHDIVGTPAYMAPEIALAPEKVDTRADLYSLGCTAYHMLTGQLPFTGKTSIETIMKHISEPPSRPELHVPTIPKDLSAVVLKLMAKNPDDRYESARELEGTLTRLPFVR